MLRRLFDRIHPKLGMPTNRQLVLENSSWDYAKTNDDALWDTEDDPQALGEAMDLRRISPALAFASMLDLAEAGSVIAMNDVGECYYWGRCDVPKDKLQAEKWFKAAFKAGSQRAMLNYGKTLAARGEYGVAEEVFRKGVDEDWAPALYWSAVLRLRQSRTPQTFFEARTLLERAIAHGHPAAKWRLGRDMAQGRHGLRNVRRGFRIFGEFISEALAAWEKRKNETPRTTSSGETLH